MITINIWLILTWQAGISVLSALCTSVALHRLRVRSATVKCQTVIAAGEGHSVLCCLPPLHAGDHAAPLVSFRAAGFVEVPF